jgi:hypothetical protein
MRLLLLGWAGFRKVFAASILPVAVKLLPGFSFFRETLHGAEPKTGEIGSVEQFAPGPEVRTKIENFVENKGFSTVLMLRRRSTIGFGHASAARDP